MIGSLPLEDFSYGMDLSGADPASLNEALRAVTTDVMSDPLRMATIASGLMFAEQGVAMNMLPAERATTAANVAASLTFSVSLIMQPFLRPEARFCGPAFQKCG